MSVFGALPIPVPFKTGFSLFVNSKTHKNEENGKQGESLSRDKGLEYSQPKSPRGTAQCCLGTMDEHCIRHCMHDKILLISLNNQQLSLVQVMEVLYPFL